MRGEGPDEELGSDLALVSGHPIVRTSYDDALATPTTITGASRDRATTNMAQLVDTLISGAKVTTVLAGADGVTLHFSSETAAKLGTGEWHIPTDRATGLPRAEARDAAHRIREPAKFRPSASMPGKIARGVVAAAHVISSIDTAIQLQTISRRIMQISEFMAADRRGQVRGLFQSLQRALADENVERRTRALEDCALQLDRLQWQFFETARAELAAIRDPEAIGIFEAMTTSGERAKRELQASLGRVFGDLRLMEFCAMMNAEVQKELGNAAALSIHERAILNAYEPMFEDLVRKSRYLDLQLAADVDKKHLVVRARLSTKRREMIDGG